MCAWNWIPKGKLHQVSQSMNLSAVFQIKYTHVKNKLHQIKLKIICGYDISFVLLILRLPADKHKLAVEIPYAIFSKETGFSNEIRRRAVENVTLPILRQAHKTALIEFFLDNINWLMEVIESKTVKVRSYFMMM